MRSLGRLRLAFALSLGVFTLLVTTATILAQHALTPSQTVDEAADESSSVSKHETTAAEAKAQTAAIADPKAAAKVARSLISYSHWLGMNVSVDGREVVMAAQASLIDRRADMRYHWSLFIHSESLDKRFVARHYDDQVFSVPVDDALEPTFSERVRLRPGTYQVEVVLHAIPAGFDLSRLKDKDTEKSVRKLSKFTKVTIPN